MATRSDVQRLTEGEPKAGADLFSPFQLQGFFWLPSNPERRISGSVRFDDTDTTVSLLGHLADQSLEDMGKLAPPMRFDCVLGQSQSGRLFTLYKCTQVGASVVVPAGVKTTRLVAECVLLDGHVFDTDSTAFSHVSIGYLHLEEWVSHQPFHMEDDGAGEQSAAGALTFSYTPQPPASYEVPAIEAVVTLESETLFTPPGLHGVRHQHFAVIKVSPCKSQAIEWYLSRIADLQSLLSLLFGEPTFPCRVKLPGRAREVAGHSYIEPLPVFFHPAYGTAGDSMHPAQMLTTYPQVRGHFETILNNFFLKHDKISTVVDLLLGSIYNKALFLQFRFLAQVQALETFCRQVQGGQYVSETQYQEIEKALASALPPWVPKDLRTSLTQGRIKYGNEFALRKRLRLLLDSLDDETCLLVTGSKKQFCEDIVSTRNYLTHYTSELRAKALAGAELLAATLRMRVLLTIVLLKELGVDEAGIREALGRPHGRLANVIRSNYSVWL